MTYLISLYERLFGKPTLAGILKTITVQIEALLEYSARSTTMANTLFDEADDLKASANNLIDNAVRAQRIADRLSELTR